MTVFQRDLCALHGTMAGTEDWMMTFQHLRSSIALWHYHVMKVHHNASSIWNKYNESILWESGREET
jgi:hypothetical protein